MLQNDTEIQTNFKFLTQLDISNRNVFLDSRLRSNCSAHHIVFYVH